MKLVKRGLLALGMLGLISCGTAESTEDNVTPATTPTGDSANNPTEPTGLINGRWLRTATLLEASSDVTGKGPWEVGARTLMAGELTAEVWYPAQPGSVGEIPTLSFTIFATSSPLKKGLRSQMRTTHGTIAIATVTFRWIRSEDLIRSLSLRTAPQVFDINPWLK